jgi:hypothetical protein
MVVVTYKAFLHDGHGLIKDPFYENAVIVT